MKYNNVKHENMETKLFYFFVLISFLFHLFLLVSNLFFLKTHNKINLEDTIEATLDVMSENVLIQEKKLSKVQQQEHSTLQSKLLPPVLDKTDQLSNKDSEESFIEKKQDIQELQKSKRLAELRKKQALQRIINRQKKIKKSIPKVQSKKIKLSKTLQDRMSHLQNKSSSQILLDGHLTSGTYANLLKKKIEKNYILPEVFDFTKIKKDPSVKIIINIRGEIIKIELVESSKDHLFDTIVLTAVKRAQPFPKPPKEWTGKEIVFPFTIKDSL